MDNVLIIGIAGGSGSGKTTLAKNICDHFEDRISVLRHDDYYKCQDHMSMEERVKTNYDHPHAFDTDLLIYHIDELRAGRDICSPTYDYSNHTRSSQVREVKARRSAKRIRDTRFMKFLQTKLIYSLTPLEL